MRIEWQPRALKDLGRLDRGAQKRVLDALERLATTGEGDIRRLVDVDPPEYRLRVGDWRIRLMLDPQAGVLAVLRVLRRDKAY